MLTDLRLRERKTHQIDDLPIDGVFLAIGHKLNTVIFEGQIEMENGCVIIRGGYAGQATQTNILGI